MNINTSIKSSIALTNNNVLNTTGALKKSEKNILSLRANTELPNGIELRGKDLPPELELYEEKRYDYNIEFESTYLDKDRHFVGGNLEKMYDKYETLYKELSESDLTDKEKEISMLALDNSFKKNTMNYSMGITTKMMIIEFKAYKSDETLNKNNENIGSFESRKAYYSNQRSAVNSSIMKLSEKVMDYFKNDMSKQGLSLNGFLNQSTGNGSKDIDNMTLNQIKSFENHLDNQEKLDTIGSDVYLNYFDGGSSDMNYHTDENYKNKTKEWIMGFTGYQSVIEKYDLK